MLAGLLALQLTLGTSVDSQVRISTFQEFDHIRANPNGNFILTDDIHIPSKRNGVSDWIPFHFGGSLDGAGHAIIGLFLSDSLSVSLGLFSSISPTACPFLLPDDSANINHDTCSSTTIAVIKNLRISDSRITSKRSAGVLTGFARNASISNVHIDGFVSGSVGVGGIIGQAGPFVAIKNSTSNIVARGSKNVGGIAGGAFWTDLQNLSCSGSITGIENIGGCVGRAEATISHDLISEAKIQAKTTAGGILGLFLGTDLGKRRLSIPAQNQTFALGFLSLNASGTIPENSPIFKIKKQSYLFTSEDSRSTIIESDIFLESDQNRWSESPIFQQMYRESSISQAISNGDIICDSFCGGIIGRSKYFPAEIYGAIHSGRITGASKIGAIAGELFSQSGARDVIVSGMIQNHSATPLFGASDGLLNGALLLTHESKSAEKFAIAPSSKTNCLPNNEGTDKCTNIFPPGVFAWDGTYFTPIQPSKQRATTNHIELNTLRKSCCADRVIKIQNNKTYKLPALQETAWWGKFLPPVPLGKPITLRQGECKNLLEAYTSFDQSRFEFSTDGSSESIRIQGSNICALQTGEQKSKPININVRTKSGGNLWSIITILPPQKQ